MAKRSFAITDIHGCANTLDALLDQIGLSQSDHLYLLGDYIDRGPRSKKVLDILLELQRNQYPITVLRGNHEQLFLDALQSRKKAVAWEKGVGATALPSFGVSKLEDIPEEYLHFIAQTELYCEIPGHILVHAGLNFEKTDPFCDPWALLWSRQWQDKIRPDWLQGRIIVHGHTPITLYDFEAQFSEKKPVYFLNLDIGCALKQQKEGYGYLCAYDLYERKCYLERNKE